MELTIHQVDAFADALFGGNPAAVVPLDAWLPDSLMQAIALENNLSETAFLVPEDRGYGLRWFTPTVEVDLCGHATLAAAWVVFNEIAHTARRVRFQTRSGALDVEREGDDLAMSFPAIPSRAADVDPRLAPALGRAPDAMRVARDWMAIFPDEDDVRSLRPDIARLREIDVHGVVVTAPARDGDFVSRYFAPRCGVDEDPVTGSAHCMLAPYWADRLGRTDLVGRQLSARSGVVRCTVDGDRVILRGRVVPYLRGTIRVEDGMRNDE